jgi:streptomycin 6-kinase
MKSAVFTPWLARWNLVPDGTAIETHSSHLLPVRRDGVPLILKVAFEKDEKTGGVLMQWWDGDGAARVFTYDGEALLLERAMGTRSLLAMVRDGRDDEATRILCDAIARLHAPRDKPLPDLIPLEPWFAELWPMAASQGGLIAETAAVARRLLGAQRDIRPLHGDIHHENVLDFGARGWLAIDPKRLLGDRAFDYANMFCNPDFASATAPGAFERRLAIVLDQSGLGRTRLLEWIFAWCGLSAAWFIGDDRAPEAATDLAVAERVRALLSA